MSTSKDEEDANSLMTQSSQALSLSPPRAPPRDSAHRQLLVGGNPSEYALAHHHDHHDDNHHRHFHGIRHRIGQMLHQSHLHMPTRIPHPHLPTSLEWTDKMTRALGVTLPTSWLNACRDSGGFRSIADTLVTVTAPTMAVTNPSLAVQFIKLSKHCRQYAYGSHRMQVVHVFFPSEEDYQELGGSVKKPRGLLFFVHGGAWGSGLPWMYRLVALPFLKLGMAVAIVGYRTWPDANVHGQVDDLEQAACSLAQQFPEFCERLPLKENPSYIGNVVMGHSSGAHISLLTLVDRARKRIQTSTFTNSLQFDSFVALSGPFNISHHFDYEAARGVEEFSPMKPVNGYSRQAFDENSPALRWMQSLVDISEMSASIKDAFPRMLLVHGIEDSTVPFTATAEAARILRSCGVERCEEVYVAKVGHQDTVMEIMMGGKTQDAVMDWIQRPPSSDEKSRESPAIVIPSNL